MSDPLIRACDHYVVLEPGQPEQLLSAHDTLAWLERHLQALESVPEDLSGLPSLAAAAQRLLETACDLELQPGLNLQWFAVRLDPPTQG
ncbi:MAG: chlororespiratory reduction protein 7 [Synechococcus sp.]